MRAYARLRRTPPAPIIGWPIGFWLWLWWAILGQKFLSLLLGQPSFVLWGVIGRVSKPQQSFNLGRYLFIQGTRSTPSMRSEEHTSELQSLTNLVCRLLLEKKKTNINIS